ncbi:MAG: type II secretion system F family protein [Chloroflexi bacterium]|nr:type II secretion system F family protein [Chloroflexota bacterium]
MNKTAAKRGSRRAKGNVSLLSKIRDFNTNPHPKIKTAEIIGFARELATLLQSGIPVVEALRLIADQRKGDPIALVIKKMIIDLHAGVPLAKAMAAHPKVFSHIFVRTVATSDKGAPVPDVLEQAANILDTADSAVSQAKQALVYPAIVLSIGFGVVILLITVVLPSMTQMLERLDQGLPLPTKILIWLSDFLIAYKYPLLATLVVGGVGTSKYLKTKRGQWQLHRLILRMPIMSSLVVASDVARASSAMASLTEAGLSLPEAVDVASETTSNLVIRAALAHSRVRLLAGEGFAAPLASTRVFPKTFVQTIRVAEETGTLNTNLRRMAQYYQRESEASVKNLVGLVEPLSTVLIAGVVGFIAMAVVMPMYSALGSLGGD